MFGSLWSFYCSLPPFRGKQRGLKFARMLPFRSARSFYGPLMENNVRDSTYRACMVGSYGTFISEALSHRKETFLFLDIGANQGIYSLCAAANRHCVHVFAFEPNPGTFSYLARNIRANKEEGRITPIAAAIGDPEDGLATISVPDGHSGAASMFGTGRQISVPIVSAATLREIFDKAQGAPIVAKIDVEGAETLVLSALRSAGLLEAIDAIIIEISSNIRGGDHGDEIRSFFSANGWRVDSRSGSDRHYDAIYVRGTGTREAEIIAS